MVDKMLESDKNLQLVRSWQRLAWINAWAVLVFIGLLLVPLTHAQGAPSAACVQEITGHIDPGEREIYRLPNLRRGDTLYIYMQRLSGSLDPLFAIADGQFTMKLFDDQLQAKLKKTPHSPFITLPKLSFRKRMPLGYKTKLLNAGFGPRLAN
jgi:hypothetical protein